MLDAAAPGCKGAELGVCSCSGAPVKHHHGCGEQDPGSPRDAVGGFVLQVWLSCCLGDVGAVGDVCPAQN